MNVVFVTNKNAARPSKRATCQDSSTAFERNEAELSFERNEAPSNAENNLTDEPIG